MALTMPPGTGAGIVYGICAAIFSGSWSWIMKVDAVKAGCHPSILTAYLATGMFASCWLVLPLLSEVNFTPFGFISGTIFCVGNALMLVAMDFVGVAIAQGCWTCAEFTVAFFWSAAIFKSHMTSEGIAVIGLFVMYIGVGCLVYTIEANGQSNSGKVLVQTSSEVVESDGEKTPLVEDQEVGSQAAPGYGGQDHTRALDMLVEKPGPTRRCLDSFGLRNVTKNELKGVSLSVLGGLIMGNVLVPMECLEYYYDNGSDYYGVKFMPSLGIGVATMTWAALGLRMLYWRARGYTAPEGNRIRGAPPQEWPNMNVATALPAGLIGGTVWMLSAVTTIYVMVTLSSYVVGIVFRAGSLIVGGLWGILVFKELAGRGIALFVGSALILATGIVIMAYFSD